ncbi:hypothetical protein JK197_14150 [Lactiplantibacillus plantarum]|uniref:hypothetical protein n=1 Tax=Lactiplantibacillus plantarum TaxID=1590 RepID=UPI001BA8534B|nr:hypothetical protein [Lactiplantibacillus plantarum]MBS0940875.1 hypothetical protein [Lactiplantibacillus plantarum]MBU7471948.1 hypothetical protein [Lactiplantibacillus plantarum]MCG0690847.1 hypothetical protein [Lactiplantibacillus plantarum]MCG0942116.1 hypothetical protein [Lactiplantibacillus plantarum]MCT3224238.1 hypothetical protein [Lactiplantibacillus plantarum]
MDNGKTTLYIRNVDQADKVKLQHLGSLAGYDNLSDFMREIISEVVAQDNLDFLINDNVSNHLIEQTALMNRVVEVTNLNTNELSEIKNLLTAMVKGDY